MIKPTDKVPELEIATVGGGTWKLADQKPELFTVVEFYRGLHCPRCKVHLLELDHRVARFNERGCDVIAISMDNQERAEKAKADWGIGALTIGYGLTAEKAREWGLFISSPIAEKEPYDFSEPGMFLIRSDGTLFSKVIHTTPFHRHHFNDVLEGIDMIRFKNYPPRGNV